MLKWFKIRAQQSVYLNPGVTGVRGELSERLQGGLSVFASLQRALIMEGKSGVLRVLSRGPRSRVCERRTCPTTAAAPALAGTAYAREIAIYL